MFGKRRKRRGGRRRLPSGAITSQPNGIKRLALTPDGSRIITGDRHGLLRVWNLSSLQLTCGPVATPLVNVGSLAVTQDGTQVIAGGYGVFGAWNVADLTPVGEPIRVLGGHEILPIPVGADVSPTPDGTRAAIACGDGLLRFYSLVDREFSGSPIRVNDLDVGFDLAVTPDGTRVISCGQEPGRSSVLRMWDVATGAAVNGPVVASGLYQCDLAVTPDGTRVITAGGGEVRVWALTADGLSAVNSARPLHGSSALAIGPSGRQIVIAGDDGNDGTVQVLSLDDLTLHATPIKTSVHTISTIAVTADGGYFVAGGLLTGKLQVYDMPLFA